MTDTSSAQGRRGADPAAEAFDGDDLAGPISDLGAIDGRRGDPADAAADGGNAVAIEMIQISHEGFEF